MDKNLDIKCLRSFAAIAELGSFTKAALRVGRSLPAVSLQIDRLEAQIGINLFQKHGRGRILTIAGEEFLNYTRAILKANDAAMAIIEINSEDELTRIGVIQDFSEDIFPNALAEFSGRYPNIRISILVDRSRVLLDALEAGKLDQVIAFKHDCSLPSDLISERKMIWIGAKNKDVSCIRPLPIIVVEGQCAFKKEAIKALDAVGIAWRIVLVSPSLACVSAAVASGLGVMVRTNDLISNRVGELRVIDDLPGLPNIEIMHYCQLVKPSEAAKQLKQYVIHNL